MFRSLVPGLESSGPATPLLVNDIIIPEYGERWPRLLERDIRQIDMIMLEAIRRCKSLKLIIRCARKFGATE
ncbi:hypothetical protein MGN70_004896 [Eutypa lata]|nr:hypothetical protein MGN70_004896 [Eutypa lata]